MKINVDGNITRLLIKKINHTRNDHLIVAVVFGLHDALALPESNILFFLEAPCY